MASNKYREFYLDTAGEQLKELSSLLLVWEKKLEDRYLVEEILQLTHSMKGAAATMDYKQTAALLHTVEDVFAGILHQNIIDNDKIFDSLLNVILPALRDNFQVIAATGQEKSLTKQINILKKLLSGKISKQKQKGANQNKRLSLRNINDPQAIFYTPLEIVVPTVKLDKIQNSIDALLVNNIRAKSLRADQDENKLLALRVESDKIINDLRRGITELRMLPLQQIFTPLPRLVRELAKAEKKKVDFIIEDNNLSLDKSVIDDLMDIIIQLLRNAVVHGITSQQSDGQIILQTEIYNDQIKITVADNGQGIDWQRILDLALQKKVITAEQSKTMTVKDIKRLIFHPGLAAVKKATLSSGRGIGLSLVKQRVEALKGRILLESSKNRGTRFAIYLPLPVSIFRSLIFKLGQFTLAVPLSYIDKMIRLPQAQDFFKDKIFTYQRTKYPLLLLKKDLNLPKLSLTTASLALLQYGQQKKVLPLPASFKEEEVVIKRTPKILQNHSLIGGVAVAANGRPVLLLDMRNLMN